MKNRNIKMKVQIALFSGLLLSSFMSGCSDTKETKSSTVSQSAEITEGSKIEIINNSNKKEIKVAQKNINRAKNDSFYYDYGEKSEYDQNAQPANKDASVRVRPRTAIDANMNIRSPYEVVQISMITSRLSKKFIVKCSACHSDYANGIIGPSLLGRDVDYIYGKIQAFKTGKKKNVLMKDLIKNMNNTEIKEMAKEIYKFDQEIRKIRNK